MNRWYILFVLLALITLPQNLDAQNQLHLELVEIIGTGRFTTPAQLVDGRVIVGTQSGVAIYDLTGQQLPSLYTASEVTAFATHGNVVVSGGRDGSLQLWDVVEGQRLHTEPASTFAAKQIIFLINDIIATSFQNDDQITIWLIRDNRLHSIRTIDTGPKVIIASEGYLTAAGDMMTFCDWSAEVCRSASLGFEIVALDPTRVSISEQAIVVEKWLWMDNTITQFIDIEPFSLDFLSVEELLIFPRNHAISGQTDFFMVNINTGAPSTPSQSLRPFKNITAISPDSFILQSHDTLERWQNNELTQTISAGIYRSDYLSVTEKWIAGGRSTAFVVNQGSNIAEFRGGTQQSMLSPDGTTLLRVPLANQTGVEIWSLEPLQFRTTLWHLGDIGVMALSGDGQRMATYTNAIRLWDMSTLGALNVISTGFTVGDGLAMNTDGTLLAAGAIDGDYRIQLWEGAVPLTTLQGHQAPIKKLIFVGGKLVSADESGVIKVWDIFENRVEFEVELDGLIDIDASNQFLVFVQHGNIVSLRDMMQFSEVLSQSLKHPGQISTVNLTTNHIYVGSKSPGVVSIWEIQE